MKKINKTDFEIMQQCKFYKKDLGHNFHLCTLYGCAGNKNAPWWKRLLSHLYIIVRFEVVENKVCVSKLSEEKRQELRDRIAKENEHE
jgi:hypothetical protein